MNFEFVRHAGSCCLQMLRFYCMLL